MSESGKLDLDAAIDTGPISVVQYVVILLCASATDLIGPTKPEATTVN